MSTTTKKHAQFVSEPMGSKSVKAVPGIGTVTACGLKRDGITQAKQLYGNYLQNPGGFKGYIGNHGGNARTQKYANQGMRDWDYQNN